jgi:L-rhamnose isomerase
MGQYNKALDAYKAIGVDTEQAISILSNLPISIHCWQADDVGGFESPDAVLSGGGIQVTGDFPGKARNIKEVQKDLEKVLSLVPGTHRLTLHASYGDFGGEKVDRDEIEPHHFDVWISWAKKHHLGIDFNGTFFSHPLAADGYTLSSKNKEIRDFWIRHAKKTREIAAYIGKELGSPCILNTWIPDGAKDITFDRMGYRKILKESLDEIFEKEYSKEYMRDAVETKLFGIGSETFVVGSHEFYMNYAARNNKMLCIDMGHFHVDEDVSDKLSSILLFDDEMLLHISRPIHWDSDHVVILSDKVKNVARELVRSGKLDNVHIGLDFFDASINRIGAYVTGIRSFQKAILTALLEPISSLQQLENEGKGFEKLATFEALNSLPFSEVYEEFLKRNNVGNDFNAITEISTYETEELRERR